MGLPGLLGKKHKTNPFIQKPGSTCRLRCAGLDPRPLAILLHRRWARGLFPGPLNQAMRAALGLEASGLQTTFLMVEVRKRQIRQPVDLHPSHGEQWSHRDYETPRNPSSLLCGLELEKPDKHLRR